MFFKRLLSTAAIVFVISLSAIDKIQCQDQDSPTEMCHIFGDPHLVMFPMAESQRDLRALYWCKSRGRMVMLKNPYVEVAVHVTEHPYYNEKFEITIFNEQSVICTINQTNKQCVHPFVDIVDLGNTFEITLLNANGLIITVTADPFYSTHVYNIQILQSFALIRQSSGLCVSRHPSCVLENAAILHGKRRKRAAASKKAETTCDAYINEAHRLTKTELNKSPTPLISAHARAACIDDIDSTNDTTWANGVISTVVIEALGRAHVKGPERLAKLKTIVPAIIKAKLEVKRNMSIPQLYD